MSWQAVKEVLAFGTPQGPQRFEKVFEPTGKKGARGKGYGAKKAVLTMLAEQHRYPKQPKATAVQVSYLDLAKAAACSVDTVKRACDWLAKAGLVVHEFAHDERGRRASNRFFINFEGEEREEFSAQVLGKVAPKRRPSPKGQNALKAHDRLKGNLLLPKGQNAGEQYLKPVSTDQREGQTLSLEESGSAQKQTAAVERNSKACLPDGWSLPAEWLQWTRNNFIATEADIGTSAAVFHDHHQGTAHTPAQWETAWRKWCRRERLFAARCVKRSDSTPARTVAPKVEMDALDLWLRGIGGGWDPRVGAEPKSDAEALARIAALEQEISKNFRSSPPTPSTEERLASCA